jgi:hypothetical protein
MSGGAAGWARQEGGRVAASARGGGASGDAAERRGEEVSLSVSNAAAVLLAENLRARPDKVAYRCAGEALSYRELGEGCRRFAHLLRRRRWW